MILLVGTNWARQLDSLIRVTNAITGSDKNGQEGIETDARIITAYLRDY